MDGPNERQAGVKNDIYPTAQNLRLDLWSRLPAPFHKQFDDTWKQPGCCPWNC